MNFNFSVMKLLNKINVALAIGAIALLAACAKDRSPRLNVTVVDDNGVLAPGAIVHAWPSDNADEGGVTVNEEEMDQTKTTDAVGQVSFDFKYSAVLDVDVVYYREELMYDSIQGEFVTVTDSLSGHKVVKVEVKRQRSEDNNYSETIIVE